MGNVPTIIINSQLRTIIFCTGYVYSRVKLWQPFLGMTIQYCCLWYKHCLENSTSIANRLFLFLHFIDISIKDTKLFTIADKLIHLKHYKIFIFVTNVISEATLLVLTCD